MADWKDKLRSGSFRGVPFKTKSSQVEGGRRKQDREFAKRDAGNSEDLGKKLKSFRLELFVIGDDYFRQRDALETALNKEGSGELIHPYRGTLKVQAGTYLLAETDDEGRLARFNVEFTEAGEIKFPDQGGDFFGSALAAIGALKDGAEAVFEAAYSVANTPAFVVDSAASVVEGVLDFAENAVSTVTEPVTNFTFAIRNLKAAVNDLVRAPEELARRLRETFDLLIDEFENDPETSEKIFGNFKTLENDPAFDPVVGITPSRIREQENKDAIFNLTKQLTLSNQSESAINVDFPTTSAALESRDDIIEQFDEQLLTVTDDDLFQTIKDLQTAVTQAVPRTGVTELIDIELKKTLPVLVIAHNEFENLEKEDEIIEQNAIEHPGFAPGGSIIQVSAE